MAYELSLESIKAACAQVFCGDMQGTGYLVRPEQLLTCAHVVGNKGSGTRVEVRFARQQLAGTVEQMEPSADWAMIRLDSVPEEISPLRCRTGGSSGGAWVAYGYPAISSGQGIVIEGAVRDPGARDVRTGTPMLQLFSEDAAAGQGPYLQGFSGAPVLSGGAVIGHLRRVLPDSTGRAELGLVFACPASAYQRSLLPAAEQSWRAPLPSAGYDPIWYVHQPNAERAALNRLRERGAPVVLQAPHSFGKKSLLEYLLSRVHQQSAQASVETRVVFIDLLQASAADRAKLDTLLAWMLASIREQLGSSAKPSKPRIAGKVPGNSLLKFRMGLEGQMSAGLPGPFILVLANGDAIYEQPYRNDFYNLLRSMVEDRTPAYERLRVLVTVSMEAALLERTDHSAFFALANAIVLSGYTRAQISEQAELYGLPHDELGLELLWQQTAGHPELARRALYEAHVQETPLSELLGQVDLHGGIFKTPLMRLRLFVDESGLRKTVCELLHNPRHGLMTEQYQKLYRKGLIIEDRPGEYRFRCRLFEDYFRALCRS